jgi:hypothetical protein
MGAFGRADHGGSAGREADARVFDRGRRVPECRDRIPAPAGKREIDRNPSPVGAGRRAFFAFYTISNHEYARTCREFGIRREAEPAA